MAVVVGQPGVVDPAHPRMISQERSDTSRILLMLSHAQSQSLCAAQCKETIEGRRRCANGILKKLQPLIRCAFAKADRTANDIRMSADVFSCRMQNKVGPEREGPLEKRRCESVVYETESSVAVGDRRGCPDIRNVQKRIRRRLDPNEPGSPGHGALDFSGLRSINE